MFEGERRVAMTPESAAQLQKLGHDCLIETGAGAEAGFSDADYSAAGVEITKTAASLWKTADVVAKVRAPEEAEVKRLRNGQTLISFINPAANDKLLKSAAKKRFYGCCDGHGATHFTCPKDGCSFFNGKHCGLPRRN